MVSMLSSSVVDRGFEPRSGQTKDYKINICCFSTKHTAQRRKNKDWLARNQNNVSQWSDMSTCGLLFQWASTKKIQNGQSRDTDNNKTQNEDKQNKKHKAEIKTKKMSNRDFTKKQAWTQMLANGKQWFTFMNGVSHAKKVVSWQN
jgi:hypothetical protein